MDWPPYHDDSYFGGIVIADNAIFKNNRRAVEFMQFNYPNISLFNSSKTYFDLDSSAIEDIEELAFNDTSIVAFQALAILEFLRDTIYPKPYQDIDISGGGSSKTSETFLIKETENLEKTDSRLYKLIPTIIVNW